MFRCLALGTCVGRGGSAMRELLMYVCNLGHIKKIRDFLSEHVTVKLISLKMRIYNAVLSVCVKHSSQYFYIYHLIPHLYGRSAIFISHFNAKETEL